MNQLTAQTRRICVTAWMCWAAGFLYAQEVRSTAAVHATEKATTAQTLLVIEPGPGRTRNSEGDIIELKDGSLALVYTRFTGGNDDHSSADLALRTSPDGGMSWSDDRVVVRNEGGCNVMSVSLLRLNSGEILLFYLRKDSSAGSCNMYVRRSSDELQTLSEPVRVTLRDGYHVVNNNRVIRLKSGRILVAAGLHSGFDDAPTTQSRFFQSAVPLAYYSDDEGRTWHRDRTPAKIPVTGAPILQEPGIVELRDGRVWMYMRCDRGAQFGCYSSDGGENWTTPEATMLRSPLSPASIQRIPWNGNLMAVWNDHSGTHLFRKGKRTPLCVAISSDDGRTWGTSRILEGNPDGWYCYTSILFQRDRALLSYCAGDSKVGGLNRLKVISFTRGWIDED